MRRTSRRRLAVGATKVAVAGAFAVLALTSAPPTALPGHGPADTAATHAANSRIESLMAAHRCAYDGFGPDVIPGSAIVSRDGAVSYVSFDEGWAVFTGDRPGTLVAVCRDAVRAS